MEATKAIELYKSRYETAVDLHQRNITKQTKLTDTFKPNESTKKRKASAEPPRGVTTQESLGESKQPEIAAWILQAMKLFNH
jgi:hypothetical protein